MNFPRANGILLHPTSLPGRFGIGDLGPQAYQFIDFLDAAGQKVWEVLPLGPAGEASSPYRGTSAFAGNPLLISPEKLVEHGYLAKADLACVPTFAERRVEFPEVTAWKIPLLRKAFAAFGETAEYRRFEEESQQWLEPFACFMTLKEANNGEPWTRWAAATKGARGEIGFQKFLQFEFFRQWRELKQYCGARGIRIFGDLSFYVDHDSADVWAHRNLFNLDPAGNPIGVGGVPPDYFSATGQLWGNPTYLWDRLAESGYRWWIERVRLALSTLDMIRLDHFRGYQAYWEIPAEKQTAVEGRWVAGPGPRLFEAVETQLHSLPFVAEDLGVITPDVEVLRERLSFPGVKVLQFGFGSDPATHTYLPHTYPKHVVAYTATHDNDTAVGWWSSRRDDLTSEGSESRSERRNAEIYLGTDGAEIHWAFIRAVMTSVADTVVVPLQDVLGLGGEARMNKSGTVIDNWCWRYRAEALTPELAARLRALTLLCDR